MLWLDEKDYRSFLEDKQKQLPQRVANYKDMHKGTAASKGVIQEFMSARTLTECKKILWGKGK
jgi:hypothetical protein